MIVIKPVTITDVTLASSSVPEPDIDLGEVEWVAGTYLTGDRRVEGHRIYQVTATTSTTDQPSVGVNASPQSWVDVAPTNRFAMFDTINSTTTKEATQLVVEIDHPSTLNSIAGFSIAGATAINISVTDPIEGVVYDTDIDMVDNSEVADWYSYFFSPIVGVSQFALLDLPAYPAATVQMTVDGTDIAFGSLVVGSLINLGIANHGTSVQLLDFSQKETDTFGNVVVVPGRTSKLVDFDVTIDKARVNYVFGVISSLTTIPSVWIGADGSNDPTLVLGYYRDYQNNISSPTLTDATIQVEGIV
jgi:hypothetical protein